MPAEEVHFCRWPRAGGRAEFSFADFSRSAYQARISLSSTGYYRTPKIHWDKDPMHGRPFFYFAYGAAVSEVAVDTLTGEMQLLRVDILHDVGSSLNPAIDLGQIEGGFLQGVGWLTSEELVWNDAGVLAHPRALDLQDSHRTGLAGARPGLAARSRRRIRRKRYIAPRPWASRR